MGDRLSLHNILTNIIPNAYYQPPENLKIEYPCIIYKRDKIQLRHANNSKYKNTTRYQVTVIDPDPDSLSPLAILGLPMCSHQRQFVVDGLNHDVFELYY